MKILEIKNLSRTYDDKVILEDINISVEENEFVCLVGPSGCGKSTLLNIIMGFDRPSEGKINDKCFVRPSRDKVMVFQDFNQLFPWLTVLENIMFAFNNKADQAEQRVKAEEYLKLVGLEGYEERYPNQLSGGQKQRVAIARALVLEPKILCMDEPFASLDVQTRSNLQNLILDISREVGTTIFFVTHDIDEALLLSDKVIVLTDLPTTIADTIINRMPYPRDRYSLEFKEKVLKINELIKQEAI